MATIFWYSDDDDDEWIRLHLAAAHSTGLTVFQVAKIAHEIVMAERDPLPPEELGDWFDFDAGKKDPSEPFEVADLFFINPVVPPPNARVDLDRAREEFQRDVERCKRLLEHHAAELSLEWLSAIYRTPMAGFASGPFVTLIRHVEHGWRRRSSKAKRTRPRCGHWPKNS